MGWSGGHHAPGNGLSIPQVLDGFSVCALSLQWGIEEQLASRLQAMAGRTEFPISIISGLRTPQEQKALARAGRPAAPVGVSTHLSCPATGADVMPQIAVTNIVKARLGAEGVRAGLRWGGGSPVDPRTGIPSDWNHFDLGPRRA